MEHDANAQAAAEAPSSLSPGVHYAWVATGPQGAIYTGVYDSPPPPDSGLTYIELDEDNLFWFDREIVRGAVQATRYRDELKAWFAEHVPG